MKWLKHFLSIFSFKKRKPLYIAKFGDSIPEVVPVNEVCVLGTASEASLAVLQCPCGCKSLLYLNLIPEESPCWKMTISSDNAVSLHPSLWKKSGCKSHFFIKSGEIKWATD